MEPYEMKGLRERCNDVINQICGYHWDLEIVRVSSEDETITVQGNFADYSSRTGAPRKTFTAKFDKKV